MNDKPPKKETKIYRVWAVMPIYVDVEAENDWNALLKAKSIPIPEWHPIKHTLYQFEAIEQ